MGAVQRFLPRMRFSLRWPGAPVRPDAVPPPRAARRIMLKRIGNRHQGSLSGCRRLDRLASIARYAARKLTGVAVRLIDCSLSGFVPHAGAASAPV